MAIEKLLEFAKDGQKNTDDLNLTDGFSVSKKPARQWFNWLFNSLTLKINEIIENKLDKTENAVSSSKLKTARTVSFFGAATGSFNFDGSGNSSCVLALANSGVVASTYGAALKIPVLTVNAKGLITRVSEQNIPIVDDLTTNDATKPLSAKQGKDLQDNKLEKDDLKDASTDQKGIVQLNNTLTSTSNTQALTASQGKVLNDLAFGVGQNWMNVKSERSLGTTYTNTTGKPIYVIVVNEFQNYGDPIEVFVNNIKLLSVDKGNGIGWFGDTSFVVPAGQTYKVTKEVYPNIQSWVELR